MVFSSKLIEDAVAQFAKLPGVGKKTALRMVLHLLKMQHEDVAAFAGAFSKMKQEIKFCAECHNVSDSDVCLICASPGRLRTQLCIVESIRDVIAIESTQHYNGLYHVLGGILSPLDGIGPEQLNLSNLHSRVAKNGVEEIIMALSPTIEGDTTAYYITKELKDLTVRVTTIARGIAFGGELEYTDEMTLGRSITKRLPIENYMSVQGKS